MKSFIKIILLNLLIALLATGTIWAADPPENSDSDTDSPGFNGNFEGPGIPDFTRFRDRDNNNQGEEETDFESEQDPTQPGANSQDAVDNWKAKRAQFQAKMEEFKAIRASIKECVEASGMDMQSTDKESLKTTIEDCLVQAGIDVEAKKAEMEARRAQFEAKIAEFKAVAAAIKECMETSGALDMETIDPKAIDPSALREAMRACLADAGIDGDSIDPDIPMDDEDSMDSDIPMDDESAMDSDIPTDDESAMDSDIPTDDESAMDSDIPTDDESAMDSDIPTDDESAMDSDFPVDQ